MKNPPEGYRLAWKNQWSNLLGVMEKIKVKGEEKNERDINRWFIVLYFKHLPENSMVSVVIFSKVVKYWFSCQEHLGSFRDTP